MPDGEVGELLVDAPSAGEGYWNQRSKSRQTFRGPLDPHRRQIRPRRRGPLHLLRPLRRHVQGLRHLGLAVRGRERADHPSRRCCEAAVVPEADPEGLLKPKAFVVLRADAKTDGLHEALKEHVKQKIGPWKYPRWIDVVDSLPKTATGKIQRFKLRDGASVSRHVVPANAGPYPRHG